MCRVHGCRWKLEQGVGTLKLELWVVMSLMCLLRTKLGASEQYSPAHLILSYQFLDLL